MTQPLLQLIDAPAALEPHHGVIVAQVVKRERPEVLRLPARLGNRLGLINSLDRRILCRADDGPRPWSIVREAKGREAPLLFTLAVDLDWMIWRVRDIALLGGAMDATKGQNATDCGDGVACFTIDG